MRDTAFLRSDELPGVVRCSDTSSATGCGRHFDLPVRGNGDGGNLFDRGGHQRAVGGILRRPDRVAIGLPRWCGRESDGAERVLAIWLGFGSTNRATSSGSRDTTPACHSRACTTLGPGTTRTVIANWTDGAWPIAELLEAPEMASGRSSDRLRRTLRFAPPNDLPRAFPSNRRGTVDRRGRDAAQRLRASLTTGMLSPGDLLVFRPPHLPSRHRHRSRREASATGPDRSGLSRSARLVGRATVSIAVATVLSSESRHVARTHGAPAAGRNWEAHRARPRPEHDPPFRGQCPPDTRALPHARATASPPVAEFPVLKHSSWTPYPSYIDIDGFRLGDGDVEGP